MSAERLRERILAVVENRISGYYLEFDKRIKAMEQALDRAGQKFKQTGEKMMAKMDDAKAVMDAAADTIMVAKGSMDKAEEAMTAAVVWMKSRPAEDQVDPTFLETMRKLQDATAGLSTETAELDASSAATAGAVADASAPKAEDPAPQPEPAPEPEPAPAPEPAPVDASTSDEGQSVVQPVEEGKAG